METDYKIMGTSASGDFKPSPEMDVIENSNGIFQAIIGNGDKKIKVTTSSGDVIFQTP